MITNVNRDLALKLRFRKVLFCQGYWCPIEVELSQYENTGTALKRVSLTDLDVLGIRYDNLFARSVVVADCKTGRNLSETSRLFWLRGVSDYFGADHAYLIHPDVSSHARGIAPRLRLRLLDEVSLGSLEDSLRVKETPLPWDDHGTHQAVMDLWGIDVAKGSKPTNQPLQLKKVYSYLSYSYWYLSQHRNVLSTVEHFRGIAAILVANDPRAVLLAYNGLQRFTHGLLEAAAFVAAQGYNNILREARSYIFGGTMNLREKEQFFTLLRSLTRSNEQLDPPYLQDVVELLGRLLRNPNGACDVLRQIDAIYLWRVHMQKSDAPPVPNVKDSTASIVLARDSAITFSKITGMPAALYSAITSL